MKSKDFKYSYLVDFLNCRAGRIFKKLDTYKVTFKREKEAKPALGFTCAIASYSDKDTYTVYL